MPEGTILPCPQKRICTIPKSAACTADQHKGCGMAITINDIVAFLGQPRYGHMSNRARAEFLTEYFGVFIDPDEVCSDIPILQVARIVEARIKIMQSSVASPTR